MWLNSKNNDKQKNIYVFILIIYFASSILSKTIWIYSLDTNFEYLLKLVRYFAYIVCMFKILFDNYYFKDLWKMAIILMFILVAGYFSASTLLFTYIFIFVSSYKIEKKTIIICSVSMQFLMWLIIVISSQIGLNEDYIFDVGTRNRHSLGFTWTTTPAVFLFFMSLEYMYLRKKRIKNIEYIIILIMSYVLYHLTNARFTFGLSVIATVCFWLLNNTKFFLLFIKKLRFIWILMPVIITVFSYSIHRYYEIGNWMWEKFDNLLSGRLKLGNSAVEQYGIKLFGQPIEWITHSYQAKEGVYNYVDCSYLQILIQYGVVFLGICLGMYTYILLKSTREEDYHLCGCILVILIFCITEPFLLNLTFNPFNLLSVSYMGERKKK